MEPDYAQRQLHSLPKNPLVQSEAPATRLNSWTVGGQYTSIWESVHLGRESDYS